MAIREPLTHILLIEHKYFKYIYICFENILSILTFSNMYEYTQCTYSHMHANIPPYIYTYKEYIYTYKEYIFLLPISPSQAV